jgi:hypothetical protein
VEIGDDGAGEGLAAAFADGAPTTKNEDGKRDPEIHPANKGSPPLRCTPGLDVESRHKSEQLPLRSDFLEYIVDLDDAEVHRVKELCRLAPDMHITHDPDQLRVVMCEHGHVIVVAAQFNTDLSIDVAEC